MVVWVLVKRCYDHSIVFFYSYRRGRRSIFSSFGGMVSSWVISWAVTLLSARLFVTFLRKVAWFTAVEAFILLLAVCTLLFHEFGLETLFSSVGKIDQGVFCGGSSHIRAMRALGQSRALAWLFPELVLLVKEAGFID